MSEKPSEKPYAIITGAGRGIGRAAAVALAQRGYRAALLARSRDELAETLRLCHANGGGGEAFVCDVADETARRQTVEKILATQPIVQAFVHCAGLALMKPTEQLSVDDFQRMLAVNLIASQDFCRLLWATWRKQNFGVVVNVSSFADRDPMPGLGAYGATKAGLRVLGKAMAREGAAIGVRVHTVSPAATETAMFRELFTAEQYSSDKTMQPEKVGNVIAQCVCGDLAITSGETIYVHKGF